MKHILLIVLLLTTGLLKAQTPTQTVRGKVIDEDSKAPLIGVNVKLSDEVTFYGASTDIEGNFKIQKVPVGRYVMEVTYIGYESKVIPNLDVEAGKENVLTIQLTESIQDLEAVTVTAEKDKDKPINEMAMVSARSFSLAETQRFAGTANDPARMASSYAGVSARGSESENEIIIRGNSPRGMLWRINGIEVPNPNHFATEGAGGGGISVINSNVLDNSDFYTGAFPAEFGNAFSGIFDINFRKGNNEKYEYAIKGGFLGSDVSAEGPISRSAGSSFLVNYRYSTLGILQELKVLEFESVSTFQDLTFNLHIPTKKFGTFSMFGIMSKSSYSETVEFDAKDTVINADDEIRIYDTIVEGDADGGYDMAAIGLINTYFLNEKTYLKSYVSFDHTAFREDDISLDGLTLTTYPDEKAKITNQAIRASVNLNRKINARNSVRAGVIHNALLYGMEWRQTEVPGPLVTLLDEQGNTSYSQGYLSWKFKLRKDLILTSGLHLSYFALNEELLVEPRAGLKWQFNPLQAVSLGFGMHSRHESISAYFGQTVDNEGNIVTPNTDLEQIKSIHYVLGYDWKLSEHLYLKSELYYQDLYDVGVEANRESAYSTLNQEVSFTTLDLEGKGTGENYGLEVSLEKFFSNSYYFLLTASLYESTYKGSDGVEHNTRYNGNHLLNLTGGKEFKVGKPLRERTLLLNTRTTIAGNNRYTPVDLERSRIEGSTVLDEDRQFNHQLGLYTRIDFSVTLIRQKKRSTREWKLDILNVTNHENEDGAYYSRELDAIVKEKDGQIIPVLSYKVKF